MSTKKLNLMNRVGFFFSFFFYGKLAYMEDDSKLSMKWLFMVEQN